jgi:Tetratricopeptide repeat
MTSCNALVYEAILRVYRNAVVDLIRSGMQAAYPDDYENRVTSRFGSWDAIVSAAARSAVTGVVAHPHQDVFDYLDVSHFPVLLDKYFSVLAPVEGLPPEQANELKRQMLSYVREIKTIRDPLSHPGTPDIGVFDALRAVDNASRALRVLGLPEAAEKIEPLLREVAAKASAPGVASRASVTVGKPVRLLPRPQGLAGRADLLAGLHVRLTSGADLRPRMVALCGLGGAGKTSVAVEYAHEHLDEVGLAWQFAAENPDVLAAGFGELAAQLGVQDAAGAWDPVASVHNVLAGFSAGWLLVFDNAPDQASVERFLPPAGPGRMLITSQNPDWPHGQALAVPVLDTDVAADFLITRTSDPDQQAARELASELDGLPLALAQAAAYILATGGTLARYLTLFRQRRPEMLRRGEPTGYSGTVATTWSLAFGRLEQSAPTAVALLRLLACCAPEPVPLSLLLQPRPGLAGAFGAEVAPALGLLLEDPLAADDAIAELRRYSLVTPAGDGLVSVHRLVQAVTVDQMTRDLLTQWRQAAAAVIEAAIPATTDAPQTWPVFALLLAHAHATLADDSDGMARTAEYLGHSGSPAAARDLSRKIVDARSRALGPEHPDTLITRNNLARWTGKAGNPAAARDQAAALLPIIERVLGPEDPRTLAVRANLASMTRAARDPAGARNQFAALLPVFERVLGADHLDTLAVREGLAWSTGEAGDKTGARDQFAALVPVAERILGPEHPRTLNDRAGLARWTGGMKDEAGARDQFAALLPVFERVLGPQHPDTLYIRHSLARWTGQAGDPASARDQFAALLPVRARVLGPDHPDTLIAHDHLAFWTGEAGDAAAARDQYAALLAVSERVRGPEHRHTLTVRGKLARWTGEAGDAAAARDQYAALLAVSERVRGPEHRHTLRVRGDLARWTGEAGNAAAARDQYAALLPMQERVLGPDHPGTLTTLGNLAHWTRKAEAGPGPNVN